MPETLTEKACTKCGEVKPISNFHRRGNRGRRGECKDCRTLVNQKRLAERGDEIRAWRRDYMSTWRAENSERVRGYKFQSRYGISRDRYDEMLEAQQGLCAICNEAETTRRPDGTVRDLSVDHDHATGAVRGLLCMLCNQALGAMRDNPSRLRRAADYLERGGA